MSIVIASTLCMIAPVPLQAMPRGSFLVRPIHTTEEFVRQIREENLAPVYRSILGLNTDDEVMDLFGELRLTRAPATKRVKMYFYRRGKGVTGSAWRTVRKGSLWFTLSDGTPLIYRECGNIVTPLPKRPFMPYRKRREPPADILPPAAELEAPFPISINSGPHSPGAVPEPSGVIVVALGAAAVGLVACRTRQRRR